MAGHCRSHEMGHALNQTCDADDLAALRAFADGLYGEVAGPLSWRANGGRSCYTWTGIYYDLGRMVGLDLSNQSLNGIIASCCHALNLSQKVLCGPSARRPTSSASSPVPWQPRGLQDVIVLPASQNGDPAVGWWWSLPSSSAGSSSLRAPSVSTEADARRLQIWLEK
ncbi:hypothetical protein ACQ4PT_061848 [Festuca glaucescens]